ncbi:hypothetical protein [Streptomyces inhibens]|uniref:hypothetical protein n=1 Tax=Streptomyces inhibens TaxID=2293571 RepID=UPI000FFBFD9D|nr:hypothetical protein [Streptomyces inhibens]
MTSAWSQRGFREVSKKLTSLRHSAAMNATSYEERMRNLLVARSAAALALASTFGSLAEPTTEAANSPRLWPSIRGEIASLERLNCAVHRQGGVSWDALASFYGVSKQSVHRRLAKDVDSYIEYAQRYIELHEADVHSRTRYLHVAANISADQVLAGAEKQSRVWSQRRRVPNWWWRDDS